MGKRKLDWTLTQAARAAFVLMELAPDWDAPQVTISRDELIARWLEHYPRHAAIKKVSTATGKPRRQVGWRVADGLKRLEQLGLAHRGGVGAEDFVLLTDLSGLRDLALRLDELEDSQGRSRPVPTPPASCPSGKKQFRTERGALLALLGIWQEAARTSDPQRRERRVYECEMCGWWHFTSKEQRSGRGDASTTSP